MFLKHSINRICAAVVIMAASQAFGQYEIDWHTVDGGGLMNITDGQPGGFELSGTIGQHDAQVPPVMFGGTFELTGGFWALTANACPCPGDMNGDGTKDGADIQQFVGCLIAGGNCSCADVNAMNGATVDDVPIFVADLLNDSDCL